ncbi:RCC1 domain-containing protein [Paenibacillus hexagrammi]|uniref:Uncharacterized protein n=1 Tax=Paenibacillus hexagrammi TaxID=2908839 RepID=A0ABY3SGR8_9BACL|nr:hypothetical protein [Paenibacillus sp. YPD9-1]UJF33179.1 hypothetical protein L0M14_27170 [Paenibacillus sp. YPD9-1]
MKPTKRSFITVKKGRVLWIATVLSLTLGSHTFADSPRIESNKNPAYAISSSDYHNVVTSSEGKVWYWGNVADRDTVVTQGEYGPEYKLKERDNKPEVMNNLEGIAAVSAQYGNGDVILKKDGTVWSWGRKLNDITGKSEFPAPQKIEGLNHITKISTDYLNAALDQDGTVWVWFPYPYTNNVTRIENIQKAKDISVGHGKLHILKSDGTVWEWSGYTNDRQNESYQAVQMKELTHVTALSSGHSDHYFVIKKDGTVWGWGNNGFGSLGLKGIDTVTKPSLIKDLQQVSSITTNDWTTVIVKKDGTAWILGAKIESESPVWNTTPEQIEGLQKVSAVTLGYNHALAVTMDGKLFAWGQNQAGQLGDATFKKSATPLPVKLQ